MVQSGNASAVGTGAGSRLEDELAAAAAREAALLVLLRDVAAIAEAQREVLGMLGREVTGTSDFVEARVTAIGGQLRRFRESRAAGPGALAGPGVDRALSGLITEVQFQDRARQRLHFVVDTLSALAECSSEIGRTIAAGLHEAPGRLPEQFVEFTARAAHDSLRRVRERIAASVPHGGPQAVYGGDFPADEGVVDLF